MFNFPNKKNFLIFFFLFFFLPSIIFSTEIRHLKKLNLIDVIKIAIKNNRSIIISTLSRDSDKENLIIAKDKFNIQPNLSLSTDYYRKYAEGLDPTDERNYSLKFDLAKQFKTGASISTSYKLVRVSRHFNPEYNSAATISFTQPLLKGFGKKIAAASLESAIIGDNISIRSYEDSISNIIKLTINAYRNLVIAQRQYEIVKKSIKLSQKLFQINQELVKAGRLPQIELIETKADLIYNKIQLLNAKNMVETAKIELIKLLGLNPDASVEVIPENFKTVKINKDEVISTTLSNRKDYLNAIDSVKLAEISYNVAKNNMLWDLSLTASVSSTGQDKTRVLKTFSEPFSGKDWDFRIGMVLNIPLSRVVLKSALIQAKNSLLKSKIALQQLKDNILSEIRNLLFRINTAFLRVEQSKLLFEVSKKKVEAEIEKFKAGKTTNFQLLSYKNQLVQSEIDLLSAKIDYMNLITELEYNEGILYKKWEFLVPENIKKLMENK